MRKSAVSTVLCALSVAGLCFPLAASAQKPPDPVMKGRDGTTTKKGQYGKFVADYGPPCKDPVHESWRKAFMKAKYLETFTERMNKFVVISRTVPVSFRETGVVNAFWSPEKGAITFDYLMIDSIADAFASEGDKGEALIRHVLNATDFILYHEMGHALVTELGLPITGREEDAVDQFSTYMLMLTHQQGKEKLQRHLKRRVCRH